MAVRLMAEEGYPWLPTLTELWLEWFVYLTDIIGLEGANGNMEWDADTPEQTAMALAHLPTLQTLQLRCPSPDELVVRVMALAEGGGLPRLTKLDIGPRVNGPPSKITAGAAFLLLLWLEQTAGPGQGMMRRQWDVQDLSRHALVRECVARIREAGAGAQV
jgi:hypothetical protein